MLKPGATPMAAKHRAVMREYMASGGMDLAEACRAIFAQIAAGEFWVSTQPEMTRQIVVGRIDFLRTQSMPALNEMARKLLQ